MFPPGARDRTVQAPPKAAEAMPCVCQRCPGLSPKCHASWSSPGPVNRSMRAMSGSHLTQSTFMLGVSDPVGGVRGGAPLMGLSGLRRRVVQLRTGT